MGKAVNRMSDIEMLGYPECAGLSDNGRCRFRKIPKCVGDGCSHFTAINSQQRAYARLCSLPESEQEQIAKKYYGGMHPWKTNASKEGKR